jgi:hypothetical protein
MGKHSANGSTKKGKAITTIIIGLILCCCIIGVIIFAIWQNEQKSNMKEQINCSINNLFTALKGTNAEEVNKYLSYNTLISSLDEMLVSDNSSQMATIEKEMFEDITWNTEGIDVSGNKAVVILEVSNKNFISVIKKWMNKEIEENESGKAITDESAVENWEKVLEEENGEAKTVIKKINLYKECGDWKVELNDNFINLVFPGIDTVNEALL